MTPRQAAQDPTTPQHQLAELARSEDAEVCAQVAQNSNTALQTLLSLARRFPREASQNPGLALALLETPQLIQSLEQETAFAFALCEDTPEWLLSLLLNQSKRELALIISHRRALSAELLVKLSSSPDCLHNVLAHPSCPEALWSTLAVQNSLATKLFIARHKALPSAARELLARDADPQVQLSLQLGAEPAMQRDTPPLSYFGATDVGVKRSFNEDAFGAHHGASLALFVVADGMGGSASGGIASQATCASLLDAAKAAEGHSTNAQELLHASFLRSYQAISEAAQREGYPLLIAGTHIVSLYGMGTAVVALLLQGNTATIAHLGDCRAYLLREQKLSLITEDHRLINELKRHNYQTTPEQLASYKNIITRALGMSVSGASPDLTRLTTRPGDLLLLCSDGLHDMIQAETIQETLLASNSLQEKVARLIDQANEAGGNDNIAALVVALS